MPAKQTYLIQLTEAERSKLQQIVNRQNDSLGRIRRAEILLHSAAQFPDINIHQIADLMNIHPQTVHRVCSRHLQGGLRYSVYACRFRKIIRLKNQDRLTLQNILIHPQSSKINIKFAKILLKAEADGKTADIKEMAESTGTTPQTVTRVLKSYLQFGLNAVLNQRGVSEFRLLKKDRITLQELLKQKVNCSWKHRRAFVLLKADAVGTKVVWRDIAQLTGASYSSVRRICNTYKRNGLESVLNFTSHRSKTPYRHSAVRLNLKERTWLQKIAKTTTRKAIRQRALILLNADENGLNRHNTDIAKQVNVCLQTVHNICKRYTEAGLEQLFECYSTNNQSTNNQNRVSFGKKRLNQLSKIRLTRKERRELQNIVREQSCSKGRINRAKILLTVDDSGKNINIDTIITKTGTSVSTIYDTCCRYLEEGFDAAVNHKQLSQPSRTVLLSERQEAELVDLYRKHPPRGRKKWTIQLLREQTLAKKIVPHISYETVRKILKKHDMIPARNQTH